MRLLKQLFTRRHRYDELSESIREHLDEKIADLIECGMTQKDAERVARLEFGNVTLIEERSREVWQWPFLESVLADLKYAIRRMLKCPIFSLTVVLTLALGVGANTAIFSIINAVMLKSLPVAKPNDLYRFGSGNDCCVLTDHQGNRWNIFSYQLYQYLKVNTPEFQDLAAFEGSVMDLSVRRSGSTAPAEPFGGEFVTANYFQMFGLNAFAGRLLLPIDDKPSAPAVTVMSYRAWRDHYGFDPTIVGQTFIIRGVPMTVVGIAPPGFYGDTVRIDPPDFWFPMSTEPQLHGSNSMIHKPSSHWLYVVGRLKEDASKSQVEARITAELRQWLMSQEGGRISDSDQISHQSISLAEAGTGIARMRRAYASGLFLLLTVSTLVLLIACANIATLLLARSTANRVQLSVRIALGATRARLIQQTLVESLVIGIIGGVAGIVVAYVGTQFILHATFHGAHFIPISASPSIQVLVFLFAISMIASLIFGAAPTWAAMRAVPSEAFKGAARASSKLAPAIQKSLVIAQVALSVTLLITAGVITRSLQNLENQGFGFQTQERVMIAVNPASAGIRAEKLPNIYRNLEQALSNTPGIVTASFSLYSPMEGIDLDSTVFIEGRPDLSTQDHPASAVWNRVGPHYFETIGTRLLEGRSIDEHDTPDSPNIAVINQAFAEKYFPREDPIGRHFGVGNMRDAGSIEVVGVVENAKYYNARGPVQPMLFRPLLQVDTEANLGNEVRSQFIHTIEIRSTVPPATLEPALRQVLSNIDRNLVALNIMTFDEQVARSFNQEHMIVDLSGFFSLLALVIASIGLYGLMSYVVIQRTPEIGIRMAIGASRTAVISMVLRSAFSQVLPGLLAGLIGAALLGQLVRSELYGVAMIDPLIIIAASLLICVCALLATSIPAWQASTVDPQLVLRNL
jgi:predicted permease